MDTSTYLLLMLALVLGSSSCYTALFVYGARFVKRAPGRDKRTPHDSKDL